MDNFNLVQSILKKGWTLVNGHWKPPEGFHDDTDLEQALEMQGIKEGKEWEPN